MRERKKTYGAKGSPDDENSSDTWSALDWIDTDTFIALQSKSSASVGHPRTWGQESGCGMGDAIEDFDGFEYRNE